MSLSLLGDALGICGAATILAAYGYQTFGKRSPDVLFYALNLTGALLLAGSLTIHYNLASLLLEVAWAGIALFGLISALRTRP